MLNFLKALFSGSLIVFLLAPLIAILPLAFTNSIVLSYPIPGFSLRWFYDIFYTSVWYNAIINSLIVGTGTTILAVILGTLAAIGLRERVFFPNLFNTLFLLPMIVPAVVTGVGMQILFSNFHIINTYGGLIIAHTVIAIPFVVICVSSSVKGIDRRLEFAAASLHASPVSVFFRITLPLAFPGIATGAVFAFATSLDEVILTMFVAGPAQRTISRQMFSTVKENVSPSIAAAAFIFIMFTILIMIVASYLHYRKNKVNKNASITSL